MTLAVWALAMAIVGAFIWRRGWQQLPRWQRWYVWCALVVVPIMWLPMVTGVFPAGILLYPFFALMAAYIIVIWGGMLVGVVALIRLILPAPSN